MSFRRLILGALAIVASAAAIAAQSQEALIRVEAAVNPLRLSRGQEGKVVLRIAVKEGIAISAQPSFVIEFTPDPTLIFPKPFYTASDLAIEVVEDGGHQLLSFKKPVEIPFAVSAKASRGVRVLEGKVKFYALSRQEGWCLKTTSRFWVTFSTRTAPAD